jgi:hypothetical protein
MYTNIIIKTLIGIGITEFKFGEGIVDETTYLEKCQEVVGVTTTNDAIFGTPTKDWTTFKAKYDEIMSTFPMDQLRIVRNEKLTETDWSQSPDVPSTTKDKWLTYRQALRDLPANANPKLDADGNLDQSSFTWPTEPS